MKIIEFTMEDYIGELRPVAIRADLVFVIRGADNGRSTVEYQVPLGVVESITVLGEAAELAKRWMTLVGGE